MLGFMQHSEIMRVGFNNSVLMGDYVNISFIQHQLVL